MTPDKIWMLVQKGTLETLYMTVPATLLAYLVGLPLGVLLVITRRDHIMPMPTLNAALGSVVNFLRSIPFLILVVLLFPITRALMNKAIGPGGMIFPLFVGAFPYVARMVENSLNEVDSGLIEAAQSMGSTAMQIILKVLLSEALPSLINSAAICLTTILAYTAMAGVVGGGGLGTIAISYGLQRNEYGVMYANSIALVVLVQIIQVVGGWLSKTLDHRRR